MVPVSSSPVGPALPAGSPPPASQTAVPVVSNTTAPSLAGATPGPAVSPTVLAFAGGMPTVGKYPIYTFNFTGSPNPFHMTVAQLEAQGAQIQPQAVDNNFFAQGIGGSGSGDPLVSGLPIYTSTASDPVYTVSCTFFSASGCAAQGKQIHIPSGPIVIQAKFDQHLSIVDKSEQVELDCWEAQQPANGRLIADWCGWYPFSGKGLSDSGSDGVHGGYSIGLSTVVAQEILQGHIDHALSMTTSCLANPTIYPADTNNGGSDSICGQGQSAQYPSANQPQYGSLIHLKLTPAQIEASGANYGCQVVLIALNKYGAYMTDTDAVWGFSVNAENDGVYNVDPTNPWQDMAELRVFTPSGATWTQCLAGLTASDFEVISIPNLGY